MYSYNYMAASMLIFHVVIERCILLFREEEILSDMVNMKDTLIEGLKTSQEISTSSLPPW